MKTNFRLVLAKVAKFQKRHPNSRRQISYHGANTYSVQFFNETTRKLVADYNVSVR